MCQREYKEDCGCGCVCPSPSPSPPAAAFPPSSLERNKFAKLGSMKQCLVSLQKEKQELDGKIRGTVMDFEGMKKGVTMEDVIDWIISHEEVSHPHH